MQPVSPMSEFVVQFRCDADYGGDGQYHDAIPAGSWSDACSFMAWEVDHDHGREARIIRHGEVLGDPADVKTLTAYQLQEHGFLPDVGLPIGGQLLIESLAHQSYCHHYVCRICREPGTQYRGFYRPSRHRAFSVCRTCGDAVELNDTERV